MSHNAEGQVGKGLLFLIKIIYKFYQEMKRGEDESLNKRPEIKKLIYFLQKSIFDIFI